MANAFLQDAVGRKPNGVFDPFAFEVLIDHGIGEAGADSIIRLDYQNDGALRIDETGVKLTRIAATGILVKLSC